MKLSIKKLLFSVSLLVIVFAFGVVADNVQKEIIAFLKPDVTIIIDGETQTFKDGEGKVVYPIIYNGTTYLPVRAISEFMAKPVAWDSNTQTVYLGSREWAGKSVVSMPDKGNGYAGQKVVSKDELTFEIGDVIKESKSFASAVRLNNLNSSEKDFIIELDNAYSTIDVGLYFMSKNANETSVMQIEDADTGIVLVSKPVKLNQYISVKDANLNGAKRLKFTAKGTLGGNGTGYFLEPIVK